MQGAARLEVLRKREAPPSSSSRLANGVRFRPAEHNDDLIIAVEVVAARKMMRLLLLRATPWPADNPWFC